MVDWSVHRMERIPFYLSYINKAKRFGNRTLNISRSTAVLQNVAKFAVLDASPI